MKRIALIYLLLVSMVLGNENYTTKLFGDINGDIIIKENIYEVHPFASLTKVMTAILVIEEVEKGNISYDDIVSVPREAKKNGGSSINLKEGEKVKLIDLLYATLVHSANDAAFTMAYYISKGNINNFVDNMNKKAKEVGMENTTFCTPNGLPTSMTGKGLDRGTGYDMYKLSLYALKKPKLLEVSSTKSKTILDRKITIYSRNKLLNKMDNVYGLKTGFHDLAGYNISVAFKKENVDYIGILFGGKTASVRDNEMMKSINDFTPPKEANDIYYVKEPVNLYKNQEILFIKDKVSLKNKSGKELYYNKINNAVVIDK